MTTTLQRYRNKSVMGDAYTGDQQLNIGNSISVIDNIVYINNVRTGINVKGDPGKSAYQIARDNGYTGSIQDWIASLTGAKGEDGKSAYEIAVDYGFEGTEEEWLESLNGTININQEPDSHGGTVVHINF